MELVAVIIGILAVLPSAVLYFLEIPARRQSAIQSSWEVVSRMEGRAAAGGRVDALLHLKASDQRLAGLVLDGAVMDGVDLQGVDLRLAKFENVTLGVCSFQNAQLNEVSLIGGTFERGCDFSHARLIGARLDGARFLDTSFVGAVFHASTGNKETSFGGSVLDQAVLSNVRFPGTKFNSASLLGVTFAHCELDKVSFRLAKMGGVVMSGVRAFEAQFQRASGVDLKIGQASQLDGANFDGSNFPAVRLERVSLRDISAFGARWPRAKLRDCDLSGADFTSADLSGAVVCNCSGANRAFLASSVKPSIFERCSE